MAVFTLDNKTEGMFFMKKFIMAAIAAIILAAGISVSASAEYPLSISYSDGYVTWEKTSPETPGVYSPTLIAAASENGVLTKVKVYNKSTSRQFFVNDDFYNGETVKFMLWYDIDGMEPMAQCIEETITGSKDAPVSVSLKTADFDYNNSAYENGYTEAGKLYFLSEGQTQEYALSDNVKLKINGFEYSDINEGISKYVIGNYMSDVVITDYAGEDGTLDGVYDEISVDYYIPMVVDDCSSSRLTADIDALYCETGEKYWIINFTEKSYKFIKDGREISVSDIAADDTLLIKSNVNKDIDDSASYEVLVSSEVLKSEISAYNEENGTYTVDGKTYSLRDMNGTLEIGTKYKLYIDAFGKIAWYEELSPAKQLAVIDAVYELASGDTTARLILSDGTAEEYALRNAEDIQAVRNIVYADEDTKNPVYDRVVEYSLTQDNKLHIKGTCEYKTVQEGIYTEKFKSIGGLCFSDETALLDNNMLKITANNLVDNYVYQIHAYDYDAENKVYRMIIVSGVEKGICAETTMAIFKRSAQTEDDDGAICTAYILLTEGVEKTILVENDAEIDLTEGDPVLYATNLDGRITEIKKLFTDTVDISDGDALWSAAFANSESLIEREYVKGLSTQRRNADLIFGVITDKYYPDGCVLVSSIENNLSDTDEEEEIGFDSDVNVYVIDYNRKDNDRVQVSTQSAIIKAYISSSAYVDSDRTVIDWSKVSIKPRLILAKTLHRTIFREATEIYVIIPKD